MFTLREIGVDVMPIISLTQSTSPAGECEAAADGILRSHHIARFILPDKELKVSGGREVCLPRFGRAGCVFAAATAR